MSEPYIEIEGAPGISMPVSAFRAPPHVNWRHVDGPLMTWAGRLHWLTWRERFAIRLGRETTETIAQKIWPQRRQFANPEPSR